MNADELQNWRENRAKAAYGKFQHRTGETKPWELLSPQYRSAWLEVERELRDEPDCDLCGNELTCANCDDIGPECPFCGAEMVCLVCEDLESTKAPEEASKKAPQNKTTS